MAPDVPPDPRPAPGSLRARRSAAAIRYGPGIPAEDQLRLCGTVDGRRVLQLGAGDGEAAAAFARQGAHVIVVEPTADAIDVARRRAEADGVGVELRHGDPAELAFVRADSVDLVFSAGALGEVADLPRVFRQVHRVLRPDGPIVAGLPHPAWGLVADHDDPAPVVRRSWFDRSGPEGSTVTHHTVADVVTGLLRSGFRVDALLEPEPVAGAPMPAAAALLPATLVVRGRKVGS